MKNTPKVIQKINDLQVLAKDFIYQGIKRKTTTPSVQSDKDKQNYHHIHQ